VPQQSETARPKNESNNQDNQSSAGPQNRSLQDIPLIRINGQRTSLKDYDGKVLLIVNTASKCGLTPQYEGLETLYKKYRANGFEILGFPSNEFMGQEPGTSEEIQNFCSTKYGVSFPLFEKTHVKGAEQHPLYAKLTTAQPKAQKNPTSDFEKKLADHGQAPEKPNDVLWNFEKFVIDRNGAVIGRFSPDLTPNDPLLVETIEKALGIDAN
jgi:glutathione peroxidase